MNRTYGMQVGLLFALAVLSASCDQPRIKCTTGHGGFAAKYTLIPGSKRGEGSCDTLVGETIGLEKYNPSTPGDREQQDLSRARLAIGSSGIGNLVMAARGSGLKVDDSAVFSIGDFSSVDPDDDDVCYVPSLSTAELEVPASDAQPATTVRYAWSDVRVYVTPALPGTQMTAKLEYTKDDCTASYSVVGLWPSVSCAVTDMMNVSTPDPTRCSPRADPAAGRPTGSGINPDLEARVACDPDLMRCVLKAPPEALQ